MTWVRTEPPDQFFVHQRIYSIMIHNLQRNRNGIYKLFWWMIRTVKIAFSIPREIEKESGNWVWLWRKSPLPYLKSLNPFNAVATFVQSTRKQSKPCHVGTHWIALTEYSLMSTHLPGFPSLFKVYCIIFYWPN